MNKISRTFQKSIQSKIELSFYKGSGDCFMQKGYFSEIITVSEYEIDEKEKDGFELFSLNNFKINGSEKKEVKKEVEEKQLINKNSKIKTSICSIDVYDDLPEFYNHCGL